MCVYAFTVLAITHINIYIYIKHEMLYNIDVVIYCSYDIRMGTICHMSTCPETLGHRKS